MKFFVAFVIVALLIFGDQLVEWTGGTAFAYLHILYVPIILAGFTFSVWGGLLTGIIAGLLMGPYITVNYVYELDQPFSSWFLRLIMFSLIGTIAGIGSSIFKAYIKELEIKNITDALTNLPNLNGLTKIFTELTHASKRPLIVVVIELFRMQEIDTAVGAESANTLINQVVKRLKEVIGNDAILGRLQSNRFALLIPEETNYMDVLKRCESLFEFSYEVNSIPLFIEMRLGVSRFPEDDTSLMQLTRKALIAINSSEKDRELISHFNKNIATSSERNLMILHKAKSALETNSFVLEYQPKIYLKTGKVMGFEALVRWTDPLLGPINPMEFIPLIEETLLINPFTKWLIKTSFDQMEAWNKQGLLVTVSINFSVMNFHDPLLFPILTEQLEKQKFSPHFLEVEVTETAVASSVSKITEAVTRLRELGIRVAIDDFGTGQASQQYLFELPINAIKIDKLFVQSISHNPAAEAIVKNAISLAHELNLEVVAEGIETRNQYDLLAKWGCDIGQGYYMGRSMSGKAATEWLKEKQK
ncbi:GGDEF domain-containing phosphodiesterase [Kamptonema cortianum]|jgi:EAL domain-containing protein (putative c-di-GMP-specific phosphodiesterase class I)/GGDEF domain-containing protein|nr:GGDEF domain-containing phosphodiesterase [Geitlerinema splendidum]MDK3160046.1 GGDEF domain-containing phosphodiesterase [Kamptonema cortianum]